MLIYDSVSLRRLWLLIGNLYFNALEDLKRLRQETVKYPKEVFRVQLQNCFFSGLIHGIYILLALLGSPPQIVSAICTLMESFLFSFEIQIDAFLQHNKFKKRMKFLAPFGPVFI